MGMFLAIGAGALSFLSPCGFPIFSAYLLYITVISVKELQGNQDVKIRSKLLSHSVFFLLGVSLIFISLGVGASFLGQWLQSLLSAIPACLFNASPGYSLSSWGFSLAVGLILPR